MSVINRVIAMIEDRVNLKLKYVIKNFIFVGGEQVLSAIFGILTIYAIGNFLTPETAGEYKYIISLAVIMSAFTLTGMTYGVTREVALGNNNIIKYAFGKSLKFAIIPITLSILVSGYYFYKFNFEYSFAIFLATVFTTLINVFLIYKSYLAGKEDFKTASKLTVFTSLIVTVISFVGFYLSSNLILIILVSLGTQALLTLFLYTKVSRFKSLESRIASEVKERYDKYVMSQSFLNIFSLSSQNIDKVIMFQFLGAKELAVYAITTVLIDRMRGILKSVGTIAYPKFVKADISSIKFNLKKQIQGYVFIITIFFIATLIMIPVVYKLILPNYIEYSQYAMIYSISLFSVLSIIPYTILQAKSMTKYLYQYEIFNNAMQMLFIFIGMYYFGLTGAIVAKSIGSIFNTATIFLFIRKFLA